MKRGLKEQAREREGKWLTVAEAADLLRVSKETIYRWVRSGKLTLYKLGRLTRLKRSELEALIVPQGVAKDHWMDLSAGAFSDWDNPGDAIYDRWKELYGLSER